MDSQLEEQLLDNFSSSLSMNNRGINSLISNQKLIFSENRDSVIDERNLKRFQMTLYRELFR
jgi:hypothetical protein